MVDKEAIQESDEYISKKVMLEDGLESVENLMDPEEEEPEEVKLDNVGAK